MVATWLSVPGCQTREDILSKRTLKVSKLCAYGASPVHTMYTECSQAAQLSHQALPALTVLLTSLEPSGSLYKGDLTHPFP